jgi:hypothetical protein
MSSRAWKVACLAGDGVGPELMAETSRVLAEVARLHALHLDDVHLPFGGEALTRSGHPLPLSTREGYRSADAVFVSSPGDPAFDGVKADLDLTWRVSRVHNEVRGDLVVVEPVGYGTDELAIARAFQLAAARRARLTSVGSTPVWTELVVAEANGWDGLEVEHLTLGDVLTRFRDHPGTVDLIAAQVCDDDEVAGLGVADATGTLLAASLLLGEGLGQRSAARTLERAVRAAEDGLRPSVTTTREFGDAVIENLSAARTDTEHFEEVWR